MDRDKNTFNAAGTTVKGLSCLSGAGTEIEKNEYPNGAAE
jgi:hypothetical protein